MNIHDGFALAVQTIIIGEVVYNVSWAYSKRDQTLFSVRTKILSLYFRIYRV